MPHTMHAPFCPCYLLSMLYFSKPSDWQQRQHVRFGVHLRCVRRCRHLPFRRTLRIEYRNLGLVWKKSWNRLKQRWPNLLGENQNVEFVTSIHVWLHFDFSLFTDFFAINSFCTRSNLSIHSIDLLTCATKIKPSQNIAKIESNWIES